MLEVIERAGHFPERAAILSGGKSYTYQELLIASERVALSLLKDQSDLQEAPVSFMVEPGFDYVSVLWGIWRAGGIAVPLCLSHPLPALDHVLRDTGSRIVVVSPEFKERMEPLCQNRGAEVLELDSSTGRMTGTLPEIHEGRMGMILYTSGTTNLPKGVVSTHRNLQAQIKTLIRAWKWSENDHALCVLPLHHVHGIVNVVSCSLWAGACCQFIREFDASEVLSIFAQGQVNVFMAVPTIYFKLITAWERRAPEDQREISGSLSSMRLMVSGSAALPVSVMDRWQAISGHRLLERYGMTELGMAISNPYEGERRPGFVGKPLDGVDVRLCNEQDVPVVDQPGEIQVRGENVFLEYWHQPETTRSSFTKDGWFKTGDVAVVENGYYRILGRSSTDIIKSGGYKISALEIEEVMRTHEGIADCAVVGLDDEEWGEIVAAVLVPRSKTIDIHALTPWLKERIPAYRVPRKYLQVTELPRNAMGKVTKMDVKKLFTT